MAYDDFPYPFQSMGLYDYNITIEGQSTNIAISKPMN